MIGTKPHSIETHLIVRGRVQGVFFRAATKKHADRLGLKGYVRNLSNGVVEICIEGEECSSLIEALKNEPSPIEIESIETKTVPLTTRYETFEIRFC